MFDRELKALSKKYPSIKDDVENLKTSLKANPKAGTEITADVYKIRLAVKSKGRGKSGGARVIYFNLFAQKVNNNEIVLISIYDKSEHSTITDKQILQALKEV